jgi:hypothetical protein
MTGGQIAFRRIAQALQRGSFGIMRLRSRSLSLDRLRRVERAWNPSQCDRLMKDKGP